MLVFLQKLYRQYVAGSPRKDIFATKTPLFPSALECATTPVVQRSKRRLTEPAAMADYVTDLNKKRRSKGSERSTSEEDRPMYVFLIIYFIYLLLLC